MPKTMNFLIKSAGVAIATATLVVGSPSLAQENNSTVIQENSSTIIIRPTPTTTSPTTTSPTTRPLRRPTLIRLPRPTVAKKSNIVEVAVANGSFNTLVAAVKAAGLVDTLSGKGPFTVFAPTDAAFAKAPAGIVETLLKPENKAALVKVLTYHVVAGKVEAKDIKDGSVLVKTVDGGSIKVTKSAKGVVIDNSKVVTPDVKASNGVIHVIDTVLLPPDLF
jgi:uncharacterized surface protein with fasciclin (FAS1) repeats